MKLPSLILGFFLTSVGLSSPSYAEPKFVDHPESYFQKEENKETQASPSFIAHPELYLMSFGPSEQEKTETGNHLTGILRKECDRVTSYLRANREDGKDLVVLCYQKDDPRPEWGLNLDHVCHAYAKVKIVLGIETDAWLVAELSNGSVNSKKMSSDSAKDLSQTIGKYVQNNENNCQDWKRFIQNHYGPLGPAD